MMLLYFPTWFQMYCRVHVFLYHNTDAGTMWYCAFVSCTPSQYIGLVFGCALFCCWESLCVLYYFLCRVLFHHDSCDFIRCFVAILFILNYMFWLSVTLLDIPFTYWIEHVTFRLLYVMFRFSTRIFIFYRWVPGFAIDYPCGVWCIGLILASCVLV